LPAEEETSSAVNGSATKLLGMRLKSVTPEIRKQLGLGDEVNGLVVTGIDRNSIAWEQGLRSEDILMRLNEAPLTSPAELKRLLADAAKQGRKNALLRVYRQGDTHFVTLPTQP